MLSIMTKLGQSIREAVLGRMEPSQLAWGVAFGVLLGVVPHTNLLALGLVALVLCLRLNHGVAAGVAVVSALFSGRLDPLSHQVGHWALTKADWSTQLADFWQLPFIPWTDLNNTVVMGSLLLGTAALVPIFLLSYPLFHLFTTSVPPLPRHAEAVAEEPAIAAKPRSVAAHKPNTSAVVQSVVFEPVTDEPKSKLRALQPHAIDAAMEEAVSGPKAPAPMPAQVIETRIDVIRLAKRKGQSQKDQIEAADISKQDQPMSEALRYLLRQARDNQDRRAA